MDFRLSEDQQAFAAAAAALFAEHCGDDQLRAHDVSGEPYQRALWPACVDTGLHAIVVPEAAGGLGLGMTDLIGVLEAQGRALALVPLWEHQLAAAAVAHFGASTLKARVLPAMLDGSAPCTATLAALADPRGPRLHLARVAGQWQLSGRQGAVPLGGDARHALLGADYDGMPRLVLVDLEQAGVAHTPGLDQHHLGVADLAFDALPLIDDAVLDIATHAWFEPRAIACLAALQLGVSAEQLRRTVQHVSERQQFGRPIGSFQLVAGGLADAHIGVETLRSALAQLVYRLDAGLGALPQALAVHAQFCDLGHFAGLKAQHVHGGVGVDLSHPAHRFLYWSRALAVHEGSAGHHLERLGDWLAGHDQLGWKYDLPEDAA